MTEDGKIKACVKVTNIGNYDGTEVVQLYIRDIFASISRPVKQLKGFKHINLQKGETLVVEFDITADLLKFYNSDLQYVCEPGEFELMIGPNSRDKYQKVGPWFRTPLLFWYLSRTSSALPCITPLSLALLP